MNYHIMCSLKIYVCIKKKNETKTPSYEIKKWANLLGWVRHRDGFVDVLVLKSMLYLLSISLKKWFWVKKVGMDQIIFLNKVGIEVGPMKYVI